MSNFLKNTEDLEKILYEISNISILLDNIQRRLEEIFLLVPQLITFTIDNIIYQAEEGMTWAQWCDSEYNTDGFYTSNSYVYHTSGNYIGMDVFGTIDRVYDVSSIYADVEYAQAQ